MKHVLLGVAAAGPAGRVVVGWVAVGGIGGAVGRPHAATCGPGWRGACWPGMPASAAAACPYAVRLAAAAAQELMRHCRQHRCLFVAAPPYEQLAKGGGGGGRRRESSPERQL